PVGKVRVTEDRSLLSGDVHELLPADRLRLYGLQMRLRDSGMGVPLIGRGAGARGSLPVTRLGTAPEFESVSAFLRLHGELARLSQGIDATLEFHPAHDPVSVDVLGKKVPLEADHSAVLAKVLDNPDLWRFSFTGLFESEHPRADDHLIFVHPYQRGRVPVVLVHGTFSSPAYWADLFNALLSDEALAGRLQF